MWRGRGRQPQTLENAQPRHRSESRRISGRGYPVKATARKRDCCPGALHEGDAIRIFSRSAAAWMDGEVVKLCEGNFVRVEWKVDGSFWRKTLHLHSEHLDIPSTIAISSDEDLKEADINGMSGAMAYITRISHHTSAALDVGKQDATCGYGKLTDLETIFKYMEKTGLRLVKGEYLKELHERQGILPRRQDIEDSNLWAGADLRKKRKDIEAGRLPLVAISHPWWSKHHPDPTGLQLAKIASIVKNIEIALRSPPSVAIFYCFCCAPQHDWRDEEVRMWMNVQSEAKRETRKPLAGMRTDAEEQTLSLILKHMHIPYASGKFHVYLLDEDDVPLDAGNPTPYSDRGWTTFEKAAARLAGNEPTSLKNANANRLFNEDRKQKEIIKPVTLYGRATPDDFNIEIKSKNFYSCRDRSHIESCYQLAYHELVTETPHNKFSCVSEFEILQEARDLHKFIKMKTTIFNVLYVALTPSAGEALKSALAGRCQGPAELMCVQLQVVVNPNEKVGKALFQVIESLGNHLEKVDIAFRLDFIDLHDKSLTKMIGKPELSNQWQQLLALVADLL